MAPDELRRRLDDAEQEAFNLRVQIAAGKAQSPSRLREVRKDIARVKTELTRKGEQA
ncbi:MAG: 50S ribosomal protein L29 [Armatimonadetes bacterium]|nr:50S ribosomal protein L29 [Armatimonadota bacterium]